MPRKFCQACLGGPDTDAKIVYRVYLTDTVRGMSKMEVCERCASCYLDEGIVFNLRRIVRKDLLQQKEKKTNA